MCSRPAQFKGALAGNVLLMFRIFVAQLDHKHLLLVEAPLKEKEGKPLAN